MTQQNKGNNHVGAIVGGVVGGGVGLALLGLLLWCCCRRRQKSRPSSIVTTEEGHEKPYKRNVPYNDGAVSPPTVPAVGYGPCHGGWWSRLSRKPTIAEKRGRLSSAPPQLSPIKTGTVTRLNGIASLGASTATGSLAAGPSEALVEPSPYPDPGPASSKRSKFSATSWSLLSLGSRGSKSRDVLSVRDPKKEQRASKQTALTHLSWSSWDILDMAPPQSAKRAAFSKFSNSSWSFITPPNAPGLGSHAGSVPPSPRVPGTPSTPDSPVPPPPPLSPLPAFNPPAFDAYANRSESEISTLPKNSFDASRSTFARTSLDSGQGPALAMLRRDDTGRPSTEAASSFSNLSSFNISRTSFKINPLRMPPSAGGPGPSALGRSRSPRSPTSPTRPHPPQGPRAPGNNFMRSVSSRIALAGFSKSKANLPDVRLSEENGNTLERLEKEIKRASQQ